MNDQLQAYGEEVRKLISLMKLTLLPLESDMNFAVAELTKAPKDQFWRRTVIRCLLATAEAMLWNMRHITPKIALVSLVQLTSKEMEALNEMREIIKEGKPELRRKWLPFPDAVKATFTLFGKVHGANISWKDEGGFTALCSTYGLRNRLMHPKTPFDPNVSDADIQTAQLGVKWLDETYNGIMKQCGEAVPKIVGSRKSGN